MIKSRHHILLYPFFKQYARWKMRSAFHRITLDGTFTDRGMPVLMVANHTSWWDGFWAVHLCRERLHRLFHFMMLEEQLKRFWFFRYTGGFSVRKHSRSALESIHYAAELLRQPNNMVLLFPQGEIQSMHCQQIVFERGAERIISIVGADRIQVIMVVFLVDYFSQPRPSLYIYYEEYIAPNKHGGLELAYRNFHAKCIARHQCTAQ